MSFVSKEIRVISGILRPGTDIRTIITPVDCPPQIVNNDDNNNEILALQSPKIIGSKVDIFPNPTTGLVSINIEKVIEKIDSLIDICVFDMHGKIVCEKNQQFNMKNIELDITKCSAGIYFIRIRSRENTYISKLVKK